jgi:protein involved in polysaccharide export with SLBB domain
MAVLFTTPAAFALDENWAAQNPNVAAMDDETSGEYTIGSGNMLQVKIYGESGIQTIFRVDELGYITHPYLGRVKVGGLTVGQSERYLEEL